MRTTPQKVDAFTVKDIAIKEVNSDMEDVNAKRL